MSDYGADDEDWFEDMWLVDDVENLPDTLAPTAYAHSPPYAPDSYDLYDSDYDEYQTSGDDSYFDGSPGPSLPASPALLPTTTTVTTKNPLPIQPNKTQTITSPTPTRTSQFVARLETRYKEAVQGKKFYGEGEIGDEKYLLTGRRRRMVGVGEGGVRKRRKVELAHSTTTSSSSTGGAVPVEVGIVEIGSRGGEEGVDGLGQGDREGEKDDDGSASAEGYNSDQDSLEDQQQPSQELPTAATATATTVRSMRKVQVVIRPPIPATVVAKPSRSILTSAPTTVGGGGGGTRGRGKVSSDTSASGGDGGGRWAGGTGRRRQTTKSPTIPPPLPDGSGPVTRNKAEIIIGEGRRGGAGGKRRTTPLRE